MLYLNSDSLILISMPGGSEMLWIVLAIVILFGGKKIPELARGLGKGMRDFKNAKDGINDEFSATLNKKEEVAANRKVVENT